MPAMSKLQVPRLRYAALGMISEKQVLRLRACGASLRMTIIWLIGNRKVPRPKIRTWGTQVYRFIRISRWILGSVNHTYFCIGMTSRTSTAITSAVWCSVIGLRRTVCHRIIAVTTSQTKNTTRVTRVIVVLPTCIPTLIVWKKSWIHLKVICPESVNWFGSNTLFIPFAL